jgi:hypothetical protein
MGLLAGQDTTLNAGDIIAIKTHMFDIMAKDALQIFEGKIYSTHALGSHLHDRLCVCMIRDLYDHFMLPVDDIEKLCKSSEVRLIHEESFIVVEFSAKIKSSLENALHLYRNELDQIPVAIHKNPILLDTKSKHDSIKTISLKEYISKRDSSHVRFIQKILTSAYVNFSDEFIKEAIEYVSKKLCKN